MNKLEPENLFHSEDGNKKNVDEILFEKIKSVQKLPDEVIRKFLLTKGNLSSGQFEERIKKIFPVNS